jgi:UDP-glucose:(heptosyl)LPS alpha-1,3-glucosyltransferase
VKIALLTRRFDPQGGGTERDLMVTAHYLLKAGHQVTAYASEIRGESGDFPVKRIGTLAPTRTGRLVAFALAAPAAARRDGNDLVLSFARTVGADVLRSGGSAHASYVAAARRWRGRISAAAMPLLPYHQAQMIIERLGFHSPRLKLVIAVSNLVRDDLLARFGLDPERVVTLYNGVDLKRFHPAESDTFRNRLRASLQLPARVPIVAFVGNGFGRKGLRFLIEAMARLGSNARLAVIGVDRADRAYRELARRLGLGPRVNFVGARGDVETFFAAADAFAMPSLFEPFGNVVMEAMASGLPALTSAQSGVAELMPSAMERYVVPNPRDVADMSVRLHEMLEAADELRSLCRETAEQYSWDRHGDNLLGILRSLG